MACQVVANLTHRLDSLWIDTPGRTGAGAVRLDAIRPMDTGKGLCHLAAVAIFHANKKDRFPGGLAHGHDSLATAEQQGLSWMHRQERTAAAAPMTGAMR